MTATNEIPLVTPGIYRHYKNKTYQVLGIGRHSETNEAVVIYRPLYKTEIEYWVRPYEMFIDQVLVNGKTVPRFEKLED